jgi:plasmid stabilization system protein ParE
VKEYKIRITGLAKEHLNAIADYIAFELNAPDAARNTIVKIRKEIKTLSYMPERIKLTEEDPWKSEGVRRMRVNNYYVYFWIDRDNEIVNIMAVIYVACDQKTRLNDLNES